jgi:hypothetical protein
MKFLKRKSGNPALIDKAWAALQQIISAKNSPSA